MGDLNNIQDDIYAEMLGDLADVSFPFIASRFIPASQDDYDPDSPSDGTTFEYSGEGIFGLSFNIKDSEIFQIEENDQKTILFKRYSTSEPKIQDSITYIGNTYKIINISVIPADNGWVLQLRRV